VRQTLKREDRGSDSQGRTPYEGLDVKKGKILWYKTYDMRTIAFQVGKGGAGRTNHGMPRQQVAGFLEGEWGSTA